MKVFRHALLLTTLCACAEPTPPGTTAALEPAGQPPLWTETAAPTIASYKIAARLDPETHRISATQTLTWRNTTSTPAATLVFHLYMNAFKNESSVFMKESKGKHRGQALASDGWGWIEISEVRVEGVPSNGTHAGPDESLWELSLATPVMPGQTVNVEMDFLVQLPQVFARTGYRDEFHMVGQWFPKIAVFEDGAWTAEPFHLNSEFYADFGNYDVSLTVPASWVVDATGVLVDVTQKDAERTLSYRAEDVHDFAWFASPSLERIDGQAGRTTVHVYYPPAQRDLAPRHLRAAVFSLERYSELLVPYPWTRMVVLCPPANAQGAAGGMEYPTLVTTSANGWYAVEGFHLPEGVTIHEVGHNWFQGILASNEAKQAWLDEGINQYMESVLLEEMFGRRSSVLSWAGLHVNMLDAAAARLRPARDVPDPIDQPPHSFSRVSRYFAATYSRTAVALRTLENQVGSQELLSALGAYAREFAYKHPDGADFFSVLDRELNGLPPWFARVFDGSGHIAYSVAAAGCEPKRVAAGVFGQGTARKRREGSENPKSHQCHVMVENTGTVAIPTEIEVRFVDGSSQRIPWRGAPGWKRFDFERTSTMREVNIDPDRQVLINDTPLRARKKLVGDSEAARVVGNRLHFWTQALMQGVGL